MYRIRDEVQSTRALERLLHKSKKLVVGLMSGTSADGIDAVLVEIAGSGTETKIRPIAFETYSYPEKYRQFLLENSDASTARLDAITRLDSLIAVMFADAVKKIATKGGKRLSNIDLIGSHGQTIHHLPASNRLFGEQVKGSLQIGNPSMLAKLTGVVTVGDFRHGDIAAGGTGAPLVPYFDYLMFRSARWNRALLNIGGIANLTVLPKQCAVKDILAFDCGPGNMLIDSCMQKLYRQPFDGLGAVAAKGMIIPALLRTLMKHPYLSERPPKSTGRETFGEGLTNEILRRFRGSRKEDVIASVTEFTPMSIFDGYVRFVRRRTKVDQLLVGGGGVHNQYLMDALKRYFVGSGVAAMETVGILSDAKEAICFAVLANEIIAGNPSNVPGATGALRRTTLGVIALP